MQVTETLSQGLKREYDISLPARDLEEKLNGQLADLKAKVRINGFRPGKVPVEHLRKVYGKSVMAEVVQEAIASANKKIVDDNGLRLAREPKVELPQDQAAIEAALEARGDLNFKVALEVLPVFEIGDFSQLELERPSAEVEGADVDLALERLAAERRTYSDKPEGGRAENQDRVTVDFNGTIDGVPFEGGEGRDIQVALGSNTFIPGFEEQLLAAAAGEERKIRATFPEAYAVRALAGKTADFDVTVKAVAAPEALAIDDEFAKGIGFESLDKLKEMIRERIAADYARASREKVKRQLLDKLDALYSFELPEGLVNQEFEFDLGAGGARAGGLRSQLRRRQYDGGGGPRGLPQDRRAPGSARALVGRGRKPCAGQGLGRRDDAGAYRPRPFLPRPGEAGLGLLPQQQPGSRRAARANLRGESRGSHPRPRQAGGEKSEQGRAHEAGRR